MGEDACSVVSAGEIVVLGRAISPQVDDRPLPLGNFYLPPRICIFIGGDMEFWLAPSPKRVDPNDDGNRTKTFDNSIR